MRCKATQLYGLNRNFVRPVDLHFVGVSAVENVMRQGMRDWQAPLHQGPLEECFDKSKLVMLSPDSPNVLEKFDEDLVYVIGGIADNCNEKKNCTLLRAVELGIAHARLPLEENFPITTRGQILNVNHAFHVLLMRCAGNSWFDSIDVAIPTRAAFRKQPSTKIGE